MANRYAVASGSWSDTATWDGGTLPTSADDVYANNFAVTVDQNIDVISLRNTSAAGITAGGTFTFNTSGVTADISDTIIMGNVASFILVTASSGLVTLNMPNAVVNGIAVAFTSTMITYSGNCNLIINCIRFIGSSTPNNFAVYMLIKTSTGDFTFNGNLEGRVSAASNPHSIILQSLSSNIINGNIISGIIISSGSLNVTGNVSGASSLSKTQPGISNTSTGTINIIGNVTGGSNFQTFGINTNNGVINITGNVTGGFGAQSIHGILFNGGTLNITGNVIGGTSTATANGILSAGGIINITGNIQGGGTTSNNGGVSTSLTVLNHIGSCIASSFVSAIFATPNSTTTLTGPFLRNGSVVANACQSFRLNALYNPYFEFRKSDNTDVIYAEQGFGFPTELDVRDGTSYASGLYTGTLAVPLPSNVRVGIATDDTVGTADLTAEDMWNYLTSNTFASGSMGERMKNVSTVASTGAQIAGF